MRWNVLFVAATLLVAASLPSAAQISIDMNKITCGGGSDTVRKNGISFVFG